MLKSKPVQDMIDQTYSIIKQGLNKGITREIPAELSARLSQNVYYFSAAKTAKEMAQISAMLKGDNGAIKPFHQFQQDVLKINDQYNKTYLNTEYNFAIASSQMAAKWAEFEQDGDEYDLQYRTAGDSNVRPEHAALDGITLPASDPFWDNYFPPNDWGCRCTAVQVLKNKYPPSNPAQAMATGQAATATPAQKIFRFNPGTSQQIFPPKHPYFKNLPKDEKKELDRLILNNADSSVKQWAKTQKSNKYEFENLQTGKLNLSAKIATRYFLPHANSPETKNIFISLASNGNRLKFERFDTLGKHKDINNPKNKKNIEKKEKRGVKGYNIYSYRYNGKTFMIGFEVIDYRYEQPYYIYNVKKP